MLPAPPGRHGSLRLLLEVLRLTGGPGILRRPLPVQQPVRPPRAVARLPPPGHQRPRVLLRREAQPLEVSLRAVLRRPGSGRRVTLAVSLPRIAVQCAVIPRLCHLSPFPLDEHIREARDKSFMGV